MDAAMPMLTMPVASIGVFFPAILSEERQEPLPEHIERGEERGEYADRPIHPASIGTRVSLPQNRIFTEESCERGESGDGKSSRRHRPERPGDFRSQSAHAPHVLLAADRVNHRPSS